MVKNDNFRMGLGGQAVVEGPGVPVLAGQLLVEPLVGLNKETGPLKNERSLTSKEKYE